MNDGVSVIIPVLNEADILATNTTTLIEYLSRLGRPFEVILVSNGSTDGTAEVGRALARSGGPVRFLVRPERGVGRAFAQGVAQARHPAIVSVDMDLSIDLDFIPRALDLLERYQIVIGSKKMGTQKRTFIRRAGSTAFILTARALLGLSFADYSIAAKAYRRAAILGHLERIDGGTSYVLEMIHHVLAEGGQALEIPVFCQDYRPSRFNLIHEGVYRFRHLFGFWWRYRIGKKAP